MKNNCLKEKLKNNRVVFGSWNTIPSPSIVEIAGNSGLDFIVIDAEHGPIGFETAENMARAAESSGIDSVIRVPMNDPALIMRALDTGISGIQVPHISTKAEAESALMSAKYYPMGNRGLSPFTRAASYGLGEKEHVKRSNEDTLVVLNVEGIEGVQNLKHIVAVKGVDVVFIGPYDLSQSMGKPGQIYDDEVIKLIKKSVQIVKKNKLVCGSFARDKEYLKILIDCGVQYLTYMVDASIISEAYKSIHNSFVDLTKKQKNK